MHKPCGQEGKFCHLGVVCSIRSNHEHLMVQPTVGSLASLPHIPDPEICLRKSGDISACMSQDQRQQVRYPSIRHPSEMQRETYFESRRFYGLRTAICTRTIRFCRLQITLHVSNVRKSKRNRFFKIERASSAPGGA